MATSRNPGESFLAYRKRVLDTKSSSFCGAKWYNSSIWLGSGMTTSCHHPLPHKIDATLIGHNPSAIHNTAEKKSHRDQMQRGERPSGCEYCWRIEDSAPDTISDRPFKSVIYTEEELESAFTTPPSHDVNLRTLEISFDRTCNLACSYCNPAFSTSWVKDIKNNGPYANLTSDGRNHFTHPHDSSQLYKLGETNPYVEAFFKWWDTDLYKTLRELRVTGGEPLMSPDLWRLLDWFEGRQSGVNLAINSNLCAKDDLINRLIERSKSISHLEIYTSCEATGVAAEYIRDGLDWNQWVGNLHKVCSAPTIKSLNMMCTINGLCLPYLPDFLRFCLNLKTQYGANYPSISLNILRFPSFQSPVVMPDTVKHKAADELETILIANANNALMHNMEREQISRLITYLREVETPHGGSSPKEVLVKDFKNFYEQYDVRRGKSFYSAFPQLVDWYNGI